MEAVPPGSPIWWRAAGDAITFGGLAYGRERVAEIAIESAPWSATPSPAQAFGAAFATIIMFDVGEADRGEAIVARLDAMSDDHRVPAIDGWIELARYMRARFCARDPAPMLAHARSAAALFDRVGDRRTRMWGTIGLGWALDSIGQLAAAADVLRATHAEAERIGLPWAISWAAIYLARVIARTGEVDQARALLHSARERVEAGGNRLYAALAKMEQARVELRVGSPSAEALAREASQQLAGFDGFRAHAVATHVRALLARNAIDEASVVALDATTGRGVLDEADFALRVARVEVALARGEKGERGAASSLCEELRLRAETLPEDLRHGYLHDVEDHARLLTVAAAHP